MGLPAEEMFERLWERFGPQGWWPGDSPFEVMVGAVLTQNTNWRNAARAIERLKEQDALTPQSIHAARPEELAEWIRPAGYYRLKARRLKNLVAHLVEQAAGDTAAFLDQPPDRLREQLLQINGIGPETADSIVLYAAGGPIFVVDSYTGRVLKRHAWIEPDADYHAIQQLFHDALPRDPELFNEYHALLVAVAKAHCKTTPDCEACPLSVLLPEGGPVPDR